METIAGGAQVEQLAKALVNSTRKPVKLSKLVTMNDSVFKPGTKPLPAGMVKGVHVEKLKVELTGVTLPLRCMKASLSAAHRPEMVAVAGFKPAGRKKLSV